MKRAIAYDITHLMHRLHYSAPSGIEKVDLTYAEHFADSELALCTAVHHGLGQPVLFPPNQVRQVVEVACDRWHENLPIEYDAKYQRLRGWLIGEGKQSLREKKQETLTKSALSNSASFLKMLYLSGTRNRGRQIPEGAVYLNVAQHALEFARLFRWLAGRSDLQKVFFIHDLLPLDYPEFWPAGYEERFRKRVDCAVSHATAFITASTCVRDRLARELATYRRSNVPILTAPLPFGRPKTADRPDLAFAAVPYFVIVGTIEPRKNHILLLNIWKELIAIGGQIPKLVIVGKRGWVNEPVLSLLDRAKNLGPHVAEVSGLADASLHRLIANARGVLVPSLAEGFGLPVVEALACGTPVLAADIDILREVSKNHALFRHTLDGSAWLEVVRELSNVDSPLAREARSSAFAFEPTSKIQYFSDVKAFLEALN